MTNSVFSPVFGPHVEGCACKRCDKHTGPHVKHCACQHCAEARETGLDEERHTVTCNRCFAVYGILNPSIRRDAGPIPCIFCGNKLKDPWK